MKETNIDTEKEKKVVICITTYNRNEDVLECLDSVYSSNFKNFNVIVFDNHSDEKINKNQLMKYSNLQYIYNDKNIGITGGKNFCEKMAKGKYIMFLDDDTIIDENTIGELVKTMDKDPKIGISAPKMFFYDNGKTNIFIAGLGQFSKLTTLCSDIVYHQKDIGQFEYQASIDYAQNGYMVRKTVSETVGGYDSKIFMTYHETEYFIKVQKLGYKTLYIPTAKLWHKLSLTSQKSNLLRDVLGLPYPQRIYYNMRNRSVIVKRYYSWYAKTIYIFFLVHLFSLYYFYKFIAYRASRDYFKYLFKGYFDGLLIFLGIKKL